MLIGVTTTTSRLYVRAFVPSAMRRTAALARTLSTSTTCTTSFNNQNNIHNKNIKSSSSRLFHSTRNYVKDPTKAQLSALTSLQDNYKLITPGEDVMALRDKQRLVCIGDVHGDIKCLKEFLKISKCYNQEQNRWIGGDTILVQCGDVLDRGNTELACFSLLSRLSRQAEQEGGRVILLWGNHEALNAAGLFHYTTGDSEYEQAVGLSLDNSLRTNRWRLQFAGNQPARWASYEPGGLLSDPLLANMKVAVQVGKTVCVHAGLKKEHLDKWGGLAGINKMAHDYIQTAHHGPNNNIGRYESVDQVMQEAQDRAKSAALPDCLGGGTGGDTPVWMRDYSNPPDAPSSAVKMLDDCLAELNADRMVVGHTVQRHINAAMNGKAWRIDVGASKGVASGTPEVLEVVRDGDEEIVSVLTKNHGKIPAAERLVDSPVSSNFIVNL